MDTMGGLRLRMVVPITDWKRRYTLYPWFVELPASTSNGLAKKSGADAFQTKSISEKRLVRRLGRVTVAHAEMIASAILICVGVP